ncbi:MAG TPA: hypothetical protein VM030_06855, partial [Acidimicrobiales bacterium]|nr:hypothetical protein [Acidimicrobiales bacterium]
MLHKRGGGLRSTAVAAITAAALLVAGLPAHAVAPSPPDLVMGKTGPASVAPDTDVTYTITAAEPRGGGVVNPSFTDVLPAGLTFVSLLVTDNKWTCTTPTPGTNGTISCTRSNNLNGSSSFTLVAHVPAGATNGSTIVNSVTGTTATSEDTSNNTASTTATVAASANLGLAKSITSAVVAGSQVTSTVQVSNAGPNTASSLSLTDVIAAPATFVSATSPTAGVSCGGVAIGGTGTVTCTLATLAPASSFTVTVTVLLPAGATGTYTNTASVTSAATDSVPANNSATASAPITAAADMGIVKSGPATVVPGTTASYTITATNAGPSDAQSVVISDSLPSGTTFVSLAEPSGWTCAKPAVGSSGLVSCSRATMAPSTAVFTLVVSIGSGVTGSVANNATVASSTTDPVPANGSSTSTGSVSVLADLAITKLDSPDPVLAGGQIAYAITATNNGPSDAPAATVTDVLPTGTTFVSLDATGWACTQPAVGSAGTVSCTRALASGASAPIALTVAVAGTAKDAIANTASVADATVTDPAPANNSASTTTGVTTSDVSVTKTAPATVTAGGTLTWTIHVLDAGPSAATAVTLADTLPAGTTFVSLSAPAAGWTCQTPAVGAAGAISCTAATLAPGADDTFTLVGAVPSSAAAGSVIANTATVSATTPDPDASNATAQSSTTVATSADVSVTKTDSPDPVVAGQSITYTITVANAGPSDATGVALADVVPTGTTFVSLTQGSGPTATLSSPAVGGGGTAGASLAT